MPRCDLDVGFQFQARAFKNRLAFLEHSPDGVEHAVQRGLDDWKGVVQDKAVEVALQPIVVASRDFLILRQ